MRQIHARDTCGVLYASHQLACATGEPDVDLLSTWFAAKGSGAFLQQEDEEDSEEERDVYFDDD